MLLSSTGEQFDLAAFGGLTNYGATRTRGFVSAALLSSIHIRTTEFEMQCTPRHTAAEFEPKFGCGCRLASERTAYALTCLAPQRDSKGQQSKGPRALPKGGGGDGGGRGGGGGGVGTPSLRSSRARALHRLRTHCSRGVVN